MRCVSSSAIGEVVSAAAGTPLGTFAEDGLRRYVEYQRLGSGAGRGDHVGETRSTIRTTFGRLIGADSSEIALVHCTKAGEQIVLDGIDPIRRRRNVVTDDLHFSGSLHNLLGLQRAGLELRIVRTWDWGIPPPGSRAKASGGKGRRVPPAWASDSCFPRRVQ